MRATSLHIVTVLLLLDAETVLALVRQIRWALDWFTVLLRPTASSVFTELEASWASLDNETIEVRLVALPVWASYWLG